ncbi:MAG: hypothetical protein HYS12_25100 [Planctomycetes bacterium]|nr:hypothetical protein [Planctomycetota bacterium]
MKPFEPAAPTWVRKRDGRTVPFEADRISRALFAAGERCGQPDAFLARELADAVVHFLADEADDKVPTTTQVREVVVKVLRGLGQHALVEAFEQFDRRKSGAGAPAPAGRTEERNGQTEAAEGAFHYSLGDTPSAVCAACTRDYTLRAVYTRDLAAAHHDGLITLGGLEAPDELASCLLGPPGGAGDGGTWPGLLERLADCSGRCVVLEGPEYALVGLGGQRPRRGALSWAERAAAKFLHDLSLGLRLTGRTAVLNVNGAPPPWADEAAAGPLFAAQLKPTDPGWVAELTDALLEAALTAEQHRSDIRFDWHLSERDFSESARERLARVARAALIGAPLTFVFDRPRRPLFLAEGVQRPHPAVLLSVGLHVPRLVALITDELRGAPGGPGERLLVRLKSLARLALSAGLQKREFLRRHVRASPALVRGFLQERARLLVSPIGLDAAVQALLGRGLCSGEEPLDLGRAILRRLREVLREEGRASALETCVDAPTEDLAPDAHEAGPLTPVLASGPTCWDAGAEVTAQMQATGELHAAAEGGTAVVFLPAKLPRPEEVAGWLRWAWKETEVVRLRLAHGAPAHRQLTFSVSENR